MSNAVNYSAIIVIMFTMIVAMVRCRVAARVARTPIPYIGGNERDRV